MAAFKVIAAADSLIAICTIPSGVILCPQNSGSGTHNPRFDKLLSSRVTGDVQKKRLGVDDVLMWNQLHGAWKDPHCAGKRCTGSGIMETNTLTIVAGNDVPKVKPV